jgi:DNA-binding transcriptional ArsR family regulator
MKHSKIDLIIHPVRLRILQAVGSERLTTQDLADRLADIPKSSIYRHIKLLLDGGYLAVSDTRPVRGVLEKVYAIAQRPHIGPEDVGNLSAEQHLQYFNVFLMTLQQAFGSYLVQAEQGGAIDFVADRAGYTEVSFHASQDELDQFVGTVNQALMSLLQNKAAPDRRRQTFSTITHPVDHS